MPVESAPVAVRLEPGPSVAGPLDGVRTTVKELIAVRGVELSANTAVELPVAWTASTNETPIVSVLRGAGARIESTSTTHELAWGITTRTAGRAVVNPVLPGRIAGGSSGGAAALVSLGAADLAVGTDTAGSVRIPAAWCDLVGWKPTFDLVSTDHVLPLAPGFDTVGFLARDVDVLDRIADVLGVGDEPRRPLRIAALQIDGAVVDPRIRPLLDQALRDAAAAGHEIADPISGPDATAIVVAFAALQLDASLRVHRDVLGTWPDQAERYGAPIRQRLLAAERLDATAVADAEAARDRLRQLAAGWFGDVDALVLPTTGCAPPTLERPDEVEIDGAWHDLRSTVLPHTTIANLIGAPAVSVPARIDGEPTGLQLLTPPGTDRRAVRLAGALSS